MLRKKPNLDDVNRRPEGARRCELNEASAMAYASIPPHNWARTRHAASTAASPPRLLREAEKRDEEQ